MSSTVGSRTRDSFTILTSESGHILALMIILPKGYSLNRWYDHTPQVKIIPLILGKNPPTSPSPSSLTRFTARNSAPQKHPRNSTCPRPPYDKSPKPEQALPALCHFSFPFALFVLSHAARTCSVPPPPRFNDVSDPDPELLIHTLYGAGGSLDDDTPYS